MGAFNTKQDAASTEEVETNYGQNESNNMRDMENAVSKINTRMGPEILDSRKPHGLETPVHRTEKVDEKCVEPKEASGYEEFNLDVESGELLRQSTPAPSTCSTQYLEQNCDNSVTTIENDKNTHVKVNVLENQQIPLKIKEELLDHGHIALDSYSSKTIPMIPIKYVPNPFEVVVAKEKPVEEFGDFKNKVIKQELIEENTDLKENNSLKKFEFQNSDHKNKLLPNTGVAIRPEILMGREYTIKQRAEIDIEQKAIKQELIEEKVENIESNGINHKKPTRWITNPFALIASITKEYAFRGSTKENHAGNISNELVTKNKIQNMYPKLLVNPFAKSKQLGKLDGIKLECDSLVPEAKSERFSDYHSLSNSSFHSLPLVNDDVCSENSKTAESLKWIVKLPEYPNTPVRTHIKRSSSNETTLEKNKPKRKRKAGIAQTQKKTINISKSKPAKPANKTNTKIQRRNRLNTRSRRKFARKNKVDVKEKKRRKPMLRGRCREHVTDKTYYCPINVTELVKHSADCRMRLRARSKAGLANKQIILFPKPLLDEKPKIVAPPAPIQIKTLKTMLHFKCDGMQSTNDPLPVVDKNQFDSKNELDCFGKVHNGIAMEEVLQKPDNQVVEQLSQLPNTLKTEIDEPIFKLEKSLKMEIDYGSLDKSTSRTLLEDSAKWMDDNASPPVFAKSMNIKRKGLPTRLEHNYKLPKSLEPRVYIKRLPLPAKVTSIGQETPSFINIKNENFIQLENRITSNNFKASTNTQRKSEFALPHAHEVSKMLPLDAPTCNKIMNLQHDSKLYQSMQPKVRLKRFALPTNFERPQLVNSCDMKFKCEAMPNTKNLFESKTALKIHEKVPQELSFDLKKNLKLLQSMQPKVRLKRLRFNEGLHRSALANTKHELNSKRADKVDSIAIASNLQPVVRLKRLKFADVKLNRCTYNENLENYTKELKVGLEVKRECDFYVKNAAYAYRKRNVCSVSIKKEKVLPNRHAEPLASTPMIRIDQAFSLQPMVRLQNLKNMAEHSTIGARTDSISETSANVTDLEMQVKTEAFEVDDEQLTPISFAKQYDEEDSGVSLDSAHNLSESFDCGLADGTVYAETDNDILCEIALQRACINELLLRNGYSPLQFRLYNNIEELKIFLDYLLVK